ncbi:hypothetical protein AVEN_234738-1 [Araneus ventricosus]|uniref:Uncharacterized protein n=1 Tax=Araneus ventricosus TaxID=182803 RepID=A0A4Y2U0B6_ARAVE|nr:hypothetical protein AVEN_234738-1 [Araneus ventricosus]
MPIPRGCLLTKVRIQSGLSVRADKYHTALFGTPEPEKQFETPNPFLSPVSPRTSVFIHSFREWSSAYLFLHWIMVLWLTNSSLPSGQPLLWEGS